MSQPSHRYFWFAVALLACSSKPATQAAVSNPTLRQELLTRLERDQAIRDTFTAQLRATGTLSPALLAAMKSVDSINLAWLKPQIKQAGFPTRAQVGPDGVKAATLLIQHADADPAFQAESLPFLEAAYKSGDVTGQEVALLTDRVAKAQGRPQRYGTQATMRDGRTIIDAIEDSAGVDARRAAMGLPPLTEYKRVLDSVYGRQQQRP